LAVAQARVARRAVKPRAPRGEPERDWVSGREGVSVHGVYFELGELRLRYGVMPAEYGREVFFAEIPDMDYVVRLAESLGLTRARSYGSLWVYSTSDREVLERAIGEVASALGRYRGEKTLYVLYIRDQLGSGISRVFNGRRVEGYEWLEEVDVVEWNYSSPGLKVVAFASEYHPAFLAGRHAFADYVELPYAPEAVDHVKSVLSKYAGLKTKRPEEADKWWGEIRSELLAFKARLQPATPTAVGESGEAVRVKIVISRLPFEQAGLRRKLNEALHRHGYRVFDIWVLRSDADTARLEKTISEIHRELEKKGYKGSYVLLVDAYFPRHILAEGLREYIKERREVYKKALQRELTETDPHKKRIATRDRQELEREIKQLEEELKRLTQQQVQ
jgi:hypothetical protein